MAIDDVTRAFAATLHGWSADEAAVEDACRLLLVDGLAVAVAGAREPGPSIMVELARAEASVPEATVIGHSFMSSAASAARINAVSMHVLDFEPIWVPPNHAVSPLLPALLALAERQERKGAEPQGERVLRGLAKGLEAQGRLRMASHQYEPNQLDFHPPGVVGPIAAAAGCGELLGLDIPRLTAAFGIAASCCAGIIGNIGTMTKALHCGNAAMRGLEATELAELGFTAAADALGARHGYGEAYFGDAFDPAELVAPLRTSRILSPGMAWKLFPSQFHTQFAISAALECRASIPDPAMIEAVTITGPVMGYVDRPNPPSGLAGKFSFQYTVSAALLDGDVNLASFSDERRFATDMEDMLRRITLRQDARISGQIDQLNVVVAVRLKDGTLIERSCNAPEGSWLRPVDGGRIRKKAQSLLSVCISPEAVEAFWRFVEAKPFELRIIDLMATLRDAYRPMSVIG